jgi:hypothetical protein
VGVIVNFLIVLSVRERWPSKETIQLKTNGTTGGATWNKKKQKTKKTRL